MWWYYNTKISCWHSFKCWKEIIHHDFPQIHGVVYSSSKKKKGEKKIQKMHFRCTVVKIYFSKRITVPQNVQSAIKKKTNQNVSYTSRNYKQRHAQCLWMLRKKNQSLTQQSSNLGFLFSTKAVMPSIRSFCKTKQEVWDFKLSELHNK